MKKFKSARIRIFTVLFSVIFSVCIFTMTPSTPIRAEAADVIDWVVDLWNYVVNNTATKSGVGEVKDKIKELKDSISEESKKGVEAYYDEQKMEFEDDDVTPASAITSATEVMAEITNYLWAYVTIGFGSGDVMGYNFDAATFVNDNQGIVVIFRIFGYSLVLLFFAISLIDQTIKYEIFTLRGAVNIFGRLILSKFLIDASTTVCLLIISISQDLCGKILSENLENIIINPSITLETSNIWVIGPIVDGLIAIIMLIPIILVYLVVSVSTCLIACKLLLRSFELTMLTTVSPAFFACFSSNTTNPYFKNFIVTFLQCAFQIVFMAVVYYVGVDKLTINGGTDIEGFADLGKWVWNTTPNALITLAMAIMIVKPPKVLTGLIHA